VLKSTNIKWEDSSIVRNDYEIRNGHRGVVVWFTGLSGSGKSTIAKAVLHKLFNDNKQVTLLDGDNIRHGLCGDLGFEEVDRSENIRRVGEVANLFYQTGMIVLCTFISPFIKDRQSVRQKFSEGSFCEVHIKCDINICKKRDPKGLYAKVAEGKISSFTGISSPYEEPTNPEILIMSDKFSVEICAEQVIKHLKLSGII